MKRYFVLNTMTACAFVIWSAVEISHDSWVSVFAATLWGFTGYNMGTCHGVEWMRKIWKLPG